MYLKPIYTCLYMLQIYNFIKQYINNTPPSIPYHPPPAPILSNHLGASSEHQAVLQKEAAWQILLQDQ
jgi:hypothetical protein